MTMANVGDKSSILTPVEDITLGRDTYRLAKNGIYTLHRPLPPDPFGVVAHTPVSWKALDEYDVENLVQLLGERTEELARLKAAVAKKD